MVILGNSQYVPVICDQLLVNTLFYLFDSHPDDIFLTDGASSGVKAVMNMMVRDGKDGVRLNFLFVAYLFLLRVILLAFRL